MIRRCSRACPGRCSAGSLLPRPPSGGSPCPWGGRGHTRGAAGVVVWGNVARGLPYPCVCGARVVLRGRPFAGRLELGTRPVQAGGEPAWTLVEGGGRLVSGSAGVHSARRRGGPVRQRSEMGGGTRSAASRERVRKLPRGLPILRWKRGAKIEAGLLFRLGARGSGGIVGLSLPVHLACRTRGCPALAREPLENAFSFARPWTEAREARLPGCRKGSRAPACGPCAKGYGLARRCCAGPHVEPSRSTPA